MQFIGIVRSVRTTALNSLTAPLMGIMALVAGSEILLAQNAPGNPPAAWHSWRGPDGSGIASTQQVPPPVAFGQEKNVVWQASIPGRGHSSPIVVGDLVLLTTADESRQIQSVLAYSRQTGELAWRRDLHEGGFNPKIHTKNTHASSTLASDGKHVYAVFNNRKRIIVSKLSMSGDVVWQKPAGDYLPIKYQFGYAASPVLHNGRVIVVADFEKTGYLAALDSGTGEIAWRTARPDQISFSSPIVARTGGREQLLLSGGAQIASYDPETGEALWSAPVTAPATCGTIVWNDTTVFASGGFPKHETAAVSSDGSATIKWRNTEKCYEQSMLYFEGHVYAVNDGGIAFCWDAASGQQQWKQRLDGGAVSASPTLVGDTIYAANERGAYYAFKATPERFVAIAKSQLGDEAFASPTVHGGRLYLRAASRASGTRQESLYCIGGK